MPKNVSQITELYLVILFIINDWPFNCAETRSKGKWLIFQ